MSSLAYRMQYRQASGASAVRIEGLNMRRSVYQMLQEAYPEALWIGWNYDLQGRICWWAMDSEDPWTGSCVFVQIN